MENVRHTSPGGIRRRGSKSAGDPHRNHHELLFNANRLPRLSDGPCSTARRGASRARLVRSLGGVRGRRSYFPTVTLSPVIVPTNGVPVEYSVTGWPVSCPRQNAS